jgi:hypothetical protein
MTVFKVVHEQSLIIDEQNRVSEVRPWTRVVIDYRAIETGWLRQYQRHWADLGLLIGIGLHARPLKGDDLDLLIRLGLAAPSDEGRLYARVTDLGLSEATGIDRKDGVPVCAQRLADSNLLKLLTLPRDFRDSRGKYEGSRAYLLMGDIITQTDDRGGLPPMARNRGGLSPTVTHRSHGGLSRIKINIPSAFTLADASGAHSAPPDSAPDSATSVSALDTEREARQPPGGLSGTGQDASRVEAQAEAAPAGSSLPGWLDHLNAALSDEKTARAFQTLVEQIEHIGLTEAGFKAAALGLLPLPERRRKVLDDLRRMQARDDLKPAQRKNRIVAILAQNIGAVLGLGLEPGGRLRVVPDKSDYAAFGALTKAHGAETVWETACDIAGRSIEGDALDYLRAALNHRRARVAGGSASDVDKVRRGEIFDQYDYSQDETSNVSQLLGDSP